MARRDRLALLIQNGGIAIPARHPIVVWNGHPRRFYDRLPRRQTAFVQWRKPLHDQLVELGHGACTEPVADASLAIVEIARARRETLGMIGAAYAGLAPGGSLVVDGDRGAGIDGILNAARSAHRVDECHSMAHGRVFRMTRAAHVPEELREWRKFLEPAPNRDGFLSAAGNFSAEAVDEGSALLAASLPELAGAGIDLGAGWGWLAYGALSSNPGIRTMTLVEGDHRALACARKNVRDSRARFEWVDALTAPACPEADFIIMNPPFHTGRAGDQGLGRAFIRRAADLLRKGGSLHMVANRRLAYESVLDTCFRNWREVTRTPRFKVFRAHGPRRRSA